MTTAITLARLRGLRLGSMAQALERQLEQIGTYEALPFLERLALLVEQECLECEHRKQDRLVRQARFKLSATVQDIDYQHPHNIKQAQIAQLSQGEWIERVRNLLITGPCGSGKTYLACGLGEQCQPTGLQRALLPPVTIAAGTDSGQGRCEISEAAGPDSQDKRSTD